MKNKSIKVTFKNGNFVYNFENIPEITQNYLKFLLEGETKFYNFQPRPQSITSPELSYFESESYGRILFDKTQFAAIVEDGRGFKIRCLKDCLLENNYDLDTFVFELNNNTKRKKGRLINHKERHLILYYGKIDSRDSDDICLSFPNRDGKYLLDNFVAFEPLGEFWGVKRVIDDEDLLLGSLYLKVSLKQ